MARKPPDDLDSRIRRLVGPMLVIGASGFIGANLLRRCLAVRGDVIGTILHHPAWRLEGISATNLAPLDLTDPAGVSSFLDRVAPQTVFDCSAYGAYSFQNDAERIHLTNYMGPVRLLGELERRGLSAYVHAGSSSEYGLNAAGPDEACPRVPNSHYAVSKSAASELITFLGRVKGLPVVNLRLYSVYGPYEDSARLIPTLAIRALVHELPPLVSPDTARDFVHVDDVVCAFVAAADRMSLQLAGDSFNIGTGRRLTIREIAQIARRLFAIRDEPIFTTMPPPPWDLEDWYANPARAERLLGWKAEIDFEEGLARSAEWWRHQIARRPPETMTESGAANPKIHS